jgi:hypothetical protein
MSQNIPDGSNVEDLQNLDQVPALLDCYISTSIVVCDALQFCVLGML